MISTKNIDLTSSSALLKQDAKLKQHAIKKEFKEQLKFNKFAIYQDLNALIVVKHSLRSKRNFLINQLRTKYKLAYTKIKSYFDPNTIYKSLIAFIKNDYQEKIEYALHNDKAKEANILKIELQEKLNSLEKQNDLIELFEQKKKALNDWYNTQKNIIIQNYIAEKISIKKQINELKIITKEKWVDKKNKLINEYKTKLEVAKQQLLNNINKHKEEVKKLKESNHFINNYGDRIEYTKIVKVKSRYFKSIKSIYNNLIILKTINDELQIKSQDIENSYKFFNDHILLNINSIEQKIIKKWNDQFSSFGTIIESKPTTIKFSIPWFLKNKIKNILLNYKEFDINNTNPFILEIIYLKILLYYYKLNKKHIDHWTNKLNLIKTELSINYNYQNIKDYQIQITKLKELEKDMSLSLKDKKLKAKYLNHIYKFKLNKNLKYLNSRINDEEKKIPLKTFKNHSWISLFISLLLPGSGQIFNRQYIKGLLLMSLNLFIIFSILMMTGALSFEGLGIRGLFKLKEIKYTSKITQTIYYDARFLIIEGVLATLFLTLSIVIYLSIAKDAFNNGKLLELGVRPKNNYELKKYFMDKGLPIALSIPAFMLILIIVVTPLASTIILAFTNYSGFNTPPGKPIEYVGFRNFGDLFSGEYARSFFYVSKWTVMWTILATGGVIITGVILAIIVDNPYVKGKKLWYIIFILPWAIPAFATTLFFGIAFNPGGFYNKWFKDVDFKNTIWLARSLIVLLQIWLGHSYIFLLVLGVKKSISSDLYEAAAIDGASKNQQFFKITWPLILAQIVPILVGTMVFYFNNFGIIYLFSSGGPIAETLPGYPGATDIIISFIFKLATTQNNRVSLASAFILFTSIFVVTPSAITFIRSNAFKKDGK